MLVWWGTEIECASALARIERENAGATGAIAESFAKLEKLASSWQEVQPATAVKQYSIRLLRVHSLRTADALQLAAAVLGSEQSPSALEFICLDNRLAEAARKEGFTVIQC